MQKAGNFMLLWYTYIVWEGYPHFWEFDVGTPLAIGSSERILVLNFYGNLLRWSLLQGDVMVVVGRFSYC